MLSCGSGLQVEVEGMREAHLRDSVALCGLLAFLEKEVHLFTACAPEPLLSLPLPAPLSSVPPPRPTPLFIN